MSEVEEMYKNAGIKAEISTNCSYYKDVVKDNDCAFYKLGVCISPINEDCEDCENIDISKCYYKQLKRLEQENKKLKANLEDIQKKYSKQYQINENKGYFKAEKELQELKQENEKLKEENIKVKKEFNNLIAEIISDIKYTGEITCNGESPKEHLHQMQKALAALVEIKNDLKEVCKEECDYTKPKFCGDCDCRYGQILTKINEVLND